MNFLKNVFKFLCLTALFVSMQLQANISLLAFKGVFAHFKPGYELYAPNIGAAALNNGTIDAIRFYNVQPGPKDAQERRLYIHDKALKNDPFAELAILLFPSPAGQLTAMTSHSQSIGAQLSVKDIAALLNFCARVRSTINSFEMRNGQKFYFMGGNEFGSNFAKVIKRLQSAEQNQVHIDYYKNLLTNNQQFNRFLPRLKELLCLLCKCIELEERDDRRTLYDTHPENYRNFAKYNEAMFYSKYTSEMLVNAFFCLKFGSENIQELISNLDDQIVDHQVMFENGLLDQLDLKIAADKKTEDITLDDLWVIQNRNLLESVTPYERKSIPVNNGLASAYDRTNKQLLTDKKYADCTETIIRHLCNLALYNKQTKHWKLDHVQQIKNRLMLQNFNNFYRIQKPEQANSGEQAIRDAWSKVMNNLNANIRYNKKFLQVGPTHNNDNEVDSGLVNIMRVLKTVFEIELKPEPMHQNDQQYVHAVVQWIEQGLKTFFQTLAPEKQNVSVRIIKVETYTAKDGRKDCFGKIEGKVDGDFKFVINISPSHAQFDSITTLAPEISNINPKKVSSATQYHYQKLQHSGEQILLFDAATKNSISTPLLKLFSENVTDSNAIIVMLKQLHQLLESNIITPARAALILRSALQRFLWQDEHMSRNIQPVLKNLYRLNNKNIQEVLAEEVKTIAGDELLSDCFNLELDHCNLDNLLIFFKNINTINLSNSGIKKLRISGDTCPHLRELDLSDTTKLESLELSGSFNALQIIDLAGSEIKTPKISGDSCPQLKELDLIMTKNLESLELSGSFNALEIIDLYGSEIKTLKISGDTCPQLKELYLSITKKLDFFELSGAFNALEKIDLDGSKINSLTLDRNLFPVLKTQYKHQV
ncbi:MAG: leucine-rich repeat domain-containing protein, partial [Myxococcales bacterium]|nr:leucine-rich repeat domain-containing protein [Myxococcales bacterium]